MPHNYARYLIKIRVLHVLRFSLLKPARNILLSWKFQPKSISLAVTRSFCVTKWILSRACHKCDLLKYTMSDSRQEELLGLLRAYPPGQIYTIAPKHYVVGGFDYYRHGSLFSFEWTDDLSALTARVGGSRTYLITVTANGHGLGFHCDCPAWATSSNCKHVICTLITIKNLLEPAAFRINGGDEERRDVLLGELCSEPHHRPLIVRKEADSEVPVARKSGYYIVFRKTGH